MNNRQYVFIGIGVLMVVFAIFAAIEFKSQMDNGAEIKRLQKINEQPLTSNFLVS